MIRLGHIEYSNCFPVHALLVSETPPDIEIIAGTPAELNARLDAGTIDVAPSSSIEYARHAQSYRLLPDFVIGSDGAVGSIIFESTRSIRDLGGATIALPTASATSVVLLKILLRQKYQADAEYTWFDQDNGPDPLAGGADAALWIGDVALRRSIPAAHSSYDLGAEWKALTGLPFVFAAWQTSAPASRDAELARLVEKLHASRAWFLRNADHLAAKSAATFGIESARLLAYWQSLRYDFDDGMQRGLLKYYELAARIGEAPMVDRLHFIT